MLCEKHAFIYKKIKPKVHVEYFEDELFDDTDDKSDMFEEDLGEDYDEVASDED